MNLLGVRFIKREFKKRSRNFVLSLIGLSTCFTFALNSHAVNNVTTEQPPLRITEAKYLEQLKNSVEYILENIQLPELRPGVVIASPSKNAPNYFYHWVRDAGLTMGEIVSLFELVKDPSSKQNLEKIIWNWIEFERQNQETAMASSILGEPIFTVTGEIYPYPWGRPQNDGPAIRALAMIQFTESLLKSNRITEARKLYLNEYPAHSPIKRDLEYVAYKWQEQNFDLWEEVKGQHFFSRMAQRTALIRGAALADKMGDPKAASFYRSKAQEIAFTLNAHKDSSRGIVVPTLDQTDGWKHKVSQMDVSVILASIYFSLDDDFFTPQDPWIKTTADRIENTFKDLYQVNKQHQDLAPAIGRYPEDVYTGTGFGEGNPWFLATHAYAELYCRLALKAKNNEEEQALRKRGYQFLERTLFHADPGGRMPEQFNRYSGYTQGARDLTWSYVSYSRALRSCALNADAAKSVNDILLNH